MYKYRMFFLYLLLASCSTITAQQCRLHAVYDSKTSKAILDWNMISFPAKITYILLRSNDGKTWSVAATDKILQNYTEDDIFDFDEKVNPADKYYYRVRITDANNNTIAFSNTEEISIARDKNSWVLYPNPVNDVLHIEYKGNSFIKGVINVIVQDFSGKIVIRFRSASIYRSLQIPVSNLHFGNYGLQVIIMNEVMLHQQFVKQ